MYDFIDRPVESLGNGGRFLLWAMCGWTHAASRGACQPVALTRGFAGVGALAALPAFPTAMALLNRGARERLNLAPMACAQIAEDEALLAGLWRDAALGHETALRGTLALMIDEGSVAPTAQALTAAAERLAEAGLAPFEPSCETHKESK